MKMTLSKISNFVEMYIFYNPRATALLCLRDTHKKWIQKLYNSKVLALIQILKTVESHTVAQTDELDL